jgi:WD40 repeat protein
VGPCHQTRVGNLKQWADVAFVALTNDLRLITVADGVGTRKVTAWDAVSGTVICEFETSTPSRGKSASFATTEFSGKVMAAIGSDDGWVEVYNVMEQEILRTCHPHDGPVHAVAVGTLGGRPVIVSGGNDGHIRLLWLDKTTDEAIDMRCKISSLALAGRGRVNRVLTILESASLWEWSADCSSCNAMRSSTSRPYAIWRTAPGRAA